MDPFPKVFFSLCGTPRVFEGRAYWLGANLSRPSKTQGVPLETAMKPATISRRGLTLLEVIVALSIFLMALVGIGRLITLASDAAVEVQQQGQAVQLAQSQLAK